jgi:hypothetical protein
MLCNALWEGEQMSRTATFPLGLESGSPEEAALVCCENDRFRSAPGRLHFPRENIVAKPGCLLILNGNQISQRISWAKGRLPGRHLKKDFSSECSDFADEHYRYRSRSRSSQIRCKSSSARTRPTTHPGPLLLPCPKLFVDLRNRSIMSKKSSA